MQASGDSPWSWSKLGGDPDARMPGMVSPEWLAVAATSAVMGAQQQNGPQQNGADPFAAALMLPQQPIQWPGSQQDGNDPFAANFFASQQQGQQQTGPDPAPAPFMHATQQPGLQQSGLGPNSAAFFSAVLAHQQGLLHYGSGLGGLPAAWVPQDLPGKSEKANPTSNETPKLPPRSKSSQRGSDAEVSQKKALLIPTCQLWDLQDGESSHGAALLLQQRKGNLGIMQGVSFVAVDGRMLWPHHTSCDS